MRTMASQITSLTVVYLTVYSGADNVLHQSSASRAFVQGIHRWAVNSGEFPVQMASNAGNVFIWWRHHAAIGWTTGDIDHCGIFKSTRDPFYVNTD